MIRLCTKLDKILFNTSGKPKDGVDNNKAWNENINSRAGYLYDSEKGFRDDSRRSVFMLFNRLVAAYLNRVYDSSTGRIYISAINEFANGAFSSAVFGKNTYKDNGIHVGNDIVGETQDEKTRGVLFHSLAVVLKRFLTEKTTNGDKKQYLETEVSELPLYMKENLRANLPVFNKLFHYLARRCELLKNIVKALNVAQNVKFTDENDMATSDVPERTDVQNKSNMINILDQVITGCNSFVQCIKITLMDIGDDPKYLEIKQGFIQEYESSNGMQPFMPQSSMLYYLNNIDISEMSFGAKDITPMLPTHGLGSTEFKMLYGTRKVLNSEEISLNDMPGVLKLMKDHNQSVDTKHQFDEKDLEKFNSCNLALLRYLIDARNYRGALFSVQQEMDGLHFMPENARSFSHTLDNLFDRLNDKIKGSVVFSLRKGTELMDVVRMTESNFQREQRREIVKIVEDSDPCKPHGNRNSMIVFNIIDLNIVPVNIHALRREIPLINLYNYSWTFDKLVGNTLELSDLSDVKLGDSIKRSDIQDSGRKLLGYMLLNPYGSIDYEIYEKFISRILRGDLGVEGLGRPKYLADELYNKPLFGELYADEIFKDEAGPGVGDGFVRGVSKVLGDNSRGLGNQYLEILREPLIYIALDGLSDDGGYQILDSELSNSKKIVESMIKEALNHQYNKNGAPKKLDQAGYTDMYKALKGIAKKNKIEESKEISAFITVLVAMSSSTDFVNTLLSEVKGYLTAIPGQKYDVDTLAKVIRDLPVAKNSFYVLKRTIASRFSPGGNQILAAPVRNDLSDALGDLGNVTNGLEKDGFNKDYVGSIFKPIASGGRKAEMSFCKIFAEGILNSRNANVYSARSIESKTGYFDQKLHYLATDDNGETKVEHVDVGEYKSLLQRIGKFRFDTVFIRNHFWLANLQRLLRLGLRRELTWYDQNVVSKHAATASSITELYGNDLHSKDFPRGYKY